MRAERRVPRSSPPAGAGVQVPLISHTGERFHDLSPSAPGLQLQEIEAQPRLPNPGFLCRTQRGPGSYPRCPEALCEEAEETRLLLLIKSFYKCAFLENFAEFGVLSTSSHPFSCSWSLSSSTINISTIGADQG